MRANLEGHAAFRAATRASAAEISLLGALVGVMVISGVWKQAEGVAYPVG
jgi:DNA-binding FadR family transcriptional regulator